MRLVVCDVRDFEHVVPGVLGVGVRGAGPVAADGDVDDEVERGCGEGVPDGLAAEVAGVDAEELLPVAEPGQGLVGPSARAPVPLHPPRVPAVIAEPDGAAPPLRLVARASRVHIAVDCPVPCRCPVHPLHDVDLPACRPADTPPDGVPEDPERGPDPCFVSAILFANCQRGGYIQALNPFGKSRSWEAF